MTMLGEDPLQESRIVSEPDRVRGIEYIIWVCLADRGLVLFARQHLMKPVFRV